MNKMVIRHFADIWIATPWIARCMFQIFEIRDMAITNKWLKDEFDRLYGVIIDNLLSSYNAKQDLMKTLNKFADDFHNGLNYRKDGNAIHMNEDIDWKLNDFFSNFIIKLHTAVKDIQKVLKLFDYDIGFFYQNEKKYIEWKIDFINNHPNEQWVIEMLDSDRVWYEKLAKIRNDYNHDGFKLKLIEYDFTENVIIPPWEIFDIEVLWENSRKFIEDSVVIMFQFLLPNILQIVTIPKEKRDPEKPIKYIVTLKEELIKQ